MLWNTQTKNSQKHTLFSMAQSNFFGILKFSQLVLDENGHNV
jgi:hypothetical protein